MSRAFGTAALRCAGLSARMLGWRPDEFWTATPAELAACLAPPADAREVTIDRAELSRMVESDRGEAP